MRKTIEQLKTMRETEDHVEFKKGEQGNVSYSGGNKVNPSDRRKCILGYVTALCNEKGGSLVIGMHDSYPHTVIGTKQNEDGVGLPSPGSIMIPASGQTSTSFTRMTSACWS